MKSLPVIFLFLVSLLAVVAVLASRPAKVRVVPVPVRVERAQARSARPLPRPYTALRQLDVGRLERELRFRQIFRD